MERKHQVIVCACMVSLSYVGTVSAAVVNLAPNAGYESEPCVDYFTYPDSCNTNGFSWDAEARHSGGHSIKVISTKPAGLLVRWLSKNEKISVAAGHTYAVSLWLKAENVAQHAELAVNFWGPSSTTFIKANGKSSEIISGTNDWRQVRVEAEAPQGAKFMRVEARLYGAGTLWADDAFVEDLSRNRVPNADFESDESESYLTLAADFTKNIFSRVSDVAHGGMSSLKIVSSQPYGEFSGWLSKNDAITVTPGKTYSVSGWVKTENIVGGRAEIAANFWGPGSNDRILINGKTSDPASGTKDWKQVSFQVTAPSNANYLKIENRIFGSGTVWFDDLDVRDESVLPKYALSAPISPPLSAVSGGVIVTRWLIVGTRGEDVRALQKYLNRTGYVVVLSGPGSQGQETDYFGPATRAAVQKFQCAKLTVCSGDENTTGYGATGPRTRERLR